MRKVQYLLFLFILSVCIYSCQEQNIPDIDVENLNTSIEKDDSEKNVNNPIEDNDSCNNEIEETIVYKLIIDPNGGRYKDATTIFETYKKANDTIDMALIIPVREGFKLANWIGYDDSNNLDLGEIAPNAVFVMPKGDVRLHAVWELELSSSEENEQEIDYTNLSHVFINGITPPKENELVHVYNDQYTWFESADTKWFDVKKRGGDSEFCWIATAAGMLHHWYIKNNDYIERYKKITSKDVSLYNATYIYNYDDDSNGNINQDIRSDPKSGIFSVFKKYVPNSAGAIRNALNWYLFDKDLPNVVALSLFSEVFSDNSIIQSKYNPNRVEFESIIKNAVSNGYAIGVEYSYTKKRGQHAVNIWGYSKNKDGIIVAIWITDSNTGVSGGNIPMHNYGIIYKDNKVKFTNLSARHYGDEIGIFAEVIELVVLQNGTEYFVGI